MAVYYNSNQSEIYKFLSYTSDDVNLNVENIYPEMKPIMIDTDSYMVSCVDSKQGRKSTRFYDGQRMKSLEGTSDVLLTT